MATATVVAHLDSPWGDWLSAITRTPAEMMGLRDAGRVGVGFPADLVIFPARRYSELLSGPQPNRLLVRAGRLVAPGIPSYRDLDASAGAVS
jgi:cytosine deaminase